MANSIFKGFKMVTSATTSFTADYLYFVRTNADKQDGYLYFNGKKYGSAKDAADELKGIIGTLPEGYTTVVGYIEGVYNTLNGAITAETSARVAKDNELYSAITAETSAREAAIAALDAEKSGASHDVKVTVKEENGKITEVSVEAPDFANLYDAKGAAATAESNAKSYADGIVTAETAARQSADAALLGDSTATTTTNATIYDVKRSVAAEVLARENAITAETAERMAADSALTESIEQLSKVVAENESAQTAALAAETSARTEADNALDARIDALENLSGQSHTHSNKTVLDGISAEKVSAWDAAEANAKGYASAYTDTKIEALDAEKSGASHDVKVTVKEANGLLTEVAVEAPDFANLYDAKGAAATAESNAKSYADGIVTAETAAREAADAALLGDSTATTTTNATIYDVKRSVAAEVLAREGAITAETAAREAKDNELYSAITAETSARETAVEGAKGYASAYTDNKISALDASVSGESHDVKVTVAEADGKLSGITVEAPDFANLYDTKGAAASAKTEVIGSASATADTLGKLETIILDNEQVTASALTALNTALSAETSARTEADNALDARIDALENLSGQSHTHSNKTVLDGISAEKVSNWDAAEANAKAYASSYTDNKISALDASVSAESHDVKVTVAEADGKLSGITVVAPDFANLYDAKGAAASAESAAKAYTDSAITALDAAVTGSSSAVTITVTEVDGKLTEATAEIQVSESSNNALEIKEDGLFAAIYYEDLDV